MCKNIIMSILAVILIMERIPWAVELAAGEKAAVMAGWTSTLIIFCFFWDKTAEKWRNYKKRVAEARAAVERILERRESFGRAGKVCGAHPGDDGRAAEKRMGKAGS